MTLVRWAEGEFSAHFTAHNRRQRLPRTADDDSRRGAPAFSVSWAWLEDRRLKTELTKTRMERDILKKSDGVFRKGVAVRYVFIECDRR